MPTSTCPSQWLRCASPASLQAECSSQASLSPKKRPSLRHLPAFLPQNVAPPASPCQSPPMLATCELFPTCPKRRRRSSRRSRNRRFSPSLAGVIEDSEEEEGDFAEAASLTSRRGSDSSFFSSTESFPLRQRESLSAGAPS